MISPSLFNLFLSATLPSTDRVENVSYAGDCKIQVSVNPIEDICGKLNAYLADIANFFTATNLSITPAKSKATLFTARTALVTDELYVASMARLIPTTKLRKVYRSTNTPP